MEPYIINFRDPWDDEMQFQYEDPAPHQVYFYNEAIEEMAEKLGLDVDDNELIPDGGYNLPQGYDHELMELADSADKVEW